MRALIDSNAFLWAAEGSRRLGSEARMVLDDPASELMLSLASIWELTIKTSLGKLGLPHPVAAFLTREAARNQVGLLPVAIGHIEATEQLPWHHRDPFDRMLIAQAQVERLAIVTSDRQFARYGVAVIW